MKSMKSLFKNEAARKILLFFNENSNCIDTAKGISLWIGADINVISLEHRKIIENEEQLIRSLYTDEILDILIVKDVIPIISNYLSY